MDFSTRQNGTLVSSKNRATSSNPLHCRARIFTFNDRGQYEPDLLQIEIDNNKETNMIRKLAALSALAMLAAPAFAETGVGAIQIDNVANVYGRAGVPAVKVTGTVVTRSADVNVAGREFAPGASAQTVVSAGDHTDQGFGRS